MHPILGALVVPARMPFHLDPVGNPSLDNRGFLWPKNRVGIVIEVDNDLGATRDPWLTILIDSKLGHCLSSEVKIL